MRKLVTEGTALTAKATLMVLIVNDARKTTSRDLTEFVFHVYVMKLVSQQCYMLTLIAAILSNCCISFGAV